VVDGTRHEIDADLIEQVQSRLHMSIEDVHARGDTRPMTMAGSPSRVPSSIAEADSSRAASMSPHMKRS